MKVLLIQPKTDDRTFPSDEMFMLEPLALEYVAASLPESYDIKLIDLRLESNFEEVLQTFNPDIVGLTAFAVHVKPVIEICKRIKEFRKNIFTIIGGYQASVWPKSFDHPCVDALVIGEGVQSFKEIAQCIENERDFRSVRGIAYREGRDMVFNEQREYPELDLLPIPRRDLTNHLRDQYFYEGIKPAASMITSKGCPFRCKFCTPWRLTNGKYVTRSPQLIVEELKTIKEPNIIVTDDESFTDVNRMGILADLIKEAGIKKNYYFLIRSDIILKCNELLRKWKDIGLTWVFAGFESNREKDLLEYNKQNTISNNEKSISILKDLGIQVFGSFIIRQDFDENDFRNLAQYVKGLKLDSAYFTVLTPLPGTEFYEEIKDEIITHEYAHLDFIHTVLPTKLPIRDFYSELALLTLKVGKDIAFQNTPQKLESYRHVYSKIKSTYKDY